MKRTVLLLIGIILFLTACTFTSSITPTPSLEPIACLADVIYEDLDDFVADVTDLLSDHKVNFDNALHVFTFPSSEVMVPRAVPHTKDIQSIEVGTYDIVYYYEIEADIDWPFPVTVVWHRGMTPKVLLNNFPIPEALSSKIVYGADGTEFFVEEVPMIELMTSMSAPGYHVRWASDWKAYSASVPKSFTDDDIAGLNSFVNVLDLKM